MCCTENVQEVWKNVLTLDGPWQQGTPPLKKKIVCLPVVSILTYILYPIFIQAYSNSIYSQPVSEELNDRCIDNNNQATISLPHINNIPIVDADPCLQTHLFLLGTYDKMSSPQLQPQPRLRLLSPNLPSSTIRPFQPLPSLFCSWTLIASGMTKVYAPDIVHGASLKNIVVTLQYSYFSYSAPSLVPLKQRLLRKPQYFDPSSRRTPRDQETRRPQLQLSRQLM